MEIISLDKKEYDYFPLHYRYVTGEYYKTEVRCSKEGFNVSFVRQRFSEEVEYDNTDTLFQEYWNNPKAFGVKDNDGKIIAYLEFDTEEWNNRIIMTQLLVDESFRGRGVGKMLFDFVKDYAKTEDYRIILFFYSNDDMGENEVMIEMAYLL